MTGKISEHSSTPRAARDACEPTKADIDRLNMNLEELIDIMAEMAGTLRPRQPRPAPERQRSFG